MKLLHFISGSSALLLAWLAVTFVYHAPTPRYQKDEMPPVSAIVTPEEKVNTFEISASSAKISGAN